MSYPWERGTWLAQGNVVTQVGLRRAGRFCPTFCATCQPQPRRGQCTRHLSQKIRYMSTKERAVSPFSDFLSLSLLRFHNFPKDDWIDAKVRLLRKRIGSSMWTFYFWQVERLQLHYRDYAYIPPPSCLNVEIYYKIPNWNRALPQARLIMSNFLDQICNVLYISNRFDRKTYFGRYFSRFRISLRTMERTSKKVERNSTSVVNRDDQLTQLIQRPLVYGSALLNSK